MMDPSSEDSEGSSSEESPVKLQAKSLEDAGSENKYSPRASAIRIKLPDYERFTKVYPIHLRDFTKYDSLVN
jgi:hypothetical protein